MTTPAFPDVVPGVDDVADSLDDAMPDGPEPIEPSEQAPSAPPPAQEFDWQNFGDAAQDMPGVQAPSYAREGRKGAAKLGPTAKIDLSDFFTEEGIGKVVARGLDGFYVSCGAAEMDRAEFNQVARVFAYYCQARLPSNAKDYQPEILLLATLGMTTLPRLGPVVQAVTPWWKNAWRWFTGLFRRDRGDVADAV